jgi:outer membrane receptor protein involved in Fe transport
MAAKRNGELLLASAILLLGSVVLAQDEQPQQAIDEEQAEDRIEEIVVLGSRLRRRDFSAPSPVVTVDRESLYSTGQGTLESALAQMPQFTPSFDRTANNPGNGRAYVNLRGLGASRTLVMLNGRRLAPSGIGTAIDLNNLPQALIENVEIVTGGASAVYGSDAVSGVVNFNIRRDFDGLGLDFSTYVTEESDSQINDLNIVYGHNFVNGRGNISVYGGYYDRVGTYAGRRTFTSVPWWDGIWDGELYEGGSPRVPSGAMWDPPVDWSGQPTDTIFNADGSPREFADEDYYNWAPWNYLQVPLRRYNAGLLFNFDLNDRNELYVEASHSHSDIDRALAPVPPGENLEINYDNPSLHPETRQLFIDNLYPAGPDSGEGFFVRRFEEFGPRIYNTESDYSRILVGLRGDAWSDWEYDAWLTYTRNDEKDRMINDGSRSRWQQGLLVDPSTGQCFDTSNGCVPVNMFGAGNLSPEAVAFLRLPPVTDETKRNQWLVSGFIRGKLIDNWAGSVMASLGAEWRVDDGSYYADPFITTGDSMEFGDYPTSDVIGEERVSEVFAELLLPLFEGAVLADYMALELGARHSRYSHAGGEDAWKAGLEWSLDGNVRLRAMFQRSVRAPNLLEAFQEQTVIEGNFVQDDPRDDLCSASANPVENGNGEKCIATGLPAEQLGIFEASRTRTLFISGGNPDVAPETADTLTVGMVVAPDATPGFRFSVDYFEIDIAGEIGSLSAVDACFDVANVDNLFCEQIVRDPNTYNVIEIREFNINRGNLRTSGVDTQVHYSAPVPGIEADFYVDVVWSHLMELTSQDTPFSSVIDCANTFGWPCDQRGDGLSWPQDRVTTRLRFDARRLSTQLNWRWIDRTENGAYIGAEVYYGLSRDDLDLAVPDVEAKSYFDLSFAYRFSDHVTAGLTIANLADTDPPMMADAVLDKNTDTRMYDIFGRSYTLSLSMHYGN